jgi:hypothetical protein
VKRRAARWGDEVKENKQQRSLFFLALRAGAGNELEPRGCCSGGVEAFQAVRCLGAAWSRNCQQGHAVAQRLQQRATAEAMPELKTSTTLMAGLNLIALH